MNINEVFEFVMYVSNKLQSGNISPDEFNITCKAVNLDLLKQRIGLPEDYQVGNPQPRVSYQITNKITDDLRLFIVKQKLTTDANGYFPVPSDYAAFSSIRFLYTESKGGKCKKPATNLKETTMFEYVTDAEMSVRLNNTVMKPTYRYPIVGFYAYGIKAYPEDISVAELTYVKYPVTPVWGYTMQGDQSVYNPLTSVDVEYPDTMFVDFCIRVLKYLSINIREEMLYDMVQQRQEKGN